MIFVALLSFLILSFSYSGPIICFYFWNFFFVIMSQQQKKTVQMVGPENRLFGLSDFGLHLSKMNCESQYDAFQETQCLLITTFSVFTNVFYGKRFDFRKHEKKLCVFSYSMHLFNQMI